MVFLMYWSLPFCALFGYIPLFQNRGERNDIFYWCKFLVDAFRIEARAIPPASALALAHADGNAADGHDDGGKNRPTQAQTQTPTQKAAPPSSSSLPSTVPVPSLGAGAPLHRGPGPVLYLANHRSWADFFLDAYLTGGRAQMLSRMAVLYAFPWFMLPITTARGCVVFKRGAIADKEAFNLWLDGKIAASPAPGLVVYPEGHRSSLPTSLPLKRGMLHYAHSRGVPVQVVMSAGKERVISEKRRRAAWGGVVATAYAPPVFPRDYADFASFMAAVQASWDAAWAEVGPWGGASREELRALLPRNDVLWPDLYVWPRHLQLAQSLFAVGAGGGLCATLWLWAKGAAWLTSGPLLAPWRPALAALAATWAAASFAASRDQGGGGAGGMGAEGGVVAPALLAWRRRRQEQPLDKKGR